MTHEVLHEHIVICIVHEVAGDTQPSSWCNLLYLSTFQHVIKSQGNDNHFAVGVISIKVYLL